MNLATFAMNAVSMISNQFAQVEIARAGAVKVTAEHTAAATFMMCEFCDGSALLCVADDAGYRWVVA